jgi:hypothetical protein
MPGPALVIASAPRGDANGNGEQRGIGNAYERAQAAAVEEPVSIANLAASTLATGVSRAEQQAAVMHDALQRATAHQAEEARLIPTPQHHGVVSTTAHTQSSELAAMAKRSAQPAEEALPIPKRVEEERLQRTSSGDELVTAHARKHKKPLDESMTEQVVSLVNDSKAERRASRSVSEKVVADGTVEIKGAARGEKVSDKDTPNAKQLFTAATSNAQTEKRLAQEQGITKELSLSKDGSSVPGSISTKRSAVPAESASSHTEIARKEATIERGDARSTVVLEARHGASDEMKRAASREDIVELSQRPQSKVQAGFVSSHGAGDIGTPQTAPSEGSLREDTHVAPSVAGVTVSDPRGVVTRPAATEMAASSDGEDGSSESTPTARSRNSKKRDNARMRNLLLQQLMAQHSNKVQREKILKALISLGISEVEYRNLLVQLGEMEVARKAEQAAATVKSVEPIALAVEVPTMKNSRAEPSAQRAEKPAVDPATTSRAALYKRLKQDASASRK